MQENNKTYRIHTNVREDSFLDVNLTQDIEQLEILSLQLDVDNFYKLHTSNYGCLVGRVLANQGVGIPNVKLSVFIPVESADLQNPVFKYLYPYSNVKSKNQDGIRYNLLPDVLDDRCHQDVGTFPNKRLVLDDNNIIEVFDKYFKYTTVTNASGDYMIFGLPTGNNIIHSELDLSDVGILSQKPRDLFYKGYSKTLFENSSQFKKDTNLDYLTQIIAQDNPVEVYSFWGDDETEGYEGVDKQVKITRYDIDINYKFEPTCIFIGSLVADDKSNGISKKCIPTERSGKMDRLTTGSGTIEMIRKTPSGKVESFSIQGNDLIDGNGTWCYQIPMNLDYMKTDEYGNFVPAENEMTGIPTRTCVRFRLSLADYESDSANAHLPKILIPNNPTLQELTDENKGVDYNFGTYTREESYRNLFWNNVYTVKQYIPRIQNIIFEGRHIDRNKNFSGIKAVNVNGSNNPIPYNNIRVNLTFLFIFQCIIFKALVLIVKMLNKIIYIAQVLADSCSSGSGNMTYILLEGGMCPALEGYQMALGAHECGCDKYVVENEPSKGCEEVPQNSASKLIYYTITSSNIGKDDQDPKQIETQGGETNPTYTMPNVASQDNRLRQQSTDPKSSDSKYGESQQPDIYNTTSGGTTFGEGVTTAQTEEFAFYTKFQENLISANDDYFVKCVELQFAMEYEVIQFDFYNDWVNGLIYLPRWFAELKRRKRVDYVNACNENFGGERELVQQCAIRYNNAGTIIKSENCGTYEYNCHRKEGRKNIDVLNKRIPLPGILQLPKDGGLIQTVKNHVDDRYLYYLKPSKTIVQENSDAIVKANLFATDIVLLGSTTDCNRYGIPTAVGYPSSSFMMPPPTGEILSDSQEMGMYFTPDDKYWGRGAGKRDSDSTNQFISQNKRLGNETDYEERQIEISGIDWGYNPFKVDKNDGTDDPANDNTTFVENQQGGHFLEIGCVAADVTPKSCINLGRICELGAEMSQSHFYDNYVVEGTSGTSYFIGTTGIISGREINGEDMRTKFAILNSNKLKTVLDASTGYDKYQFQGYTPYNFDGSLTTWGQLLSGNTYKDFFKNSGEGQSLSYVAFRFAEDMADVNPKTGESGLITKDEENGTRPSIERKCLYKVEEGVYSMPVYENSFYFYFGLKDGNTAIDRLYTEYFSECVDNEHVEGEIEPLQGRIATKYKPVFDDNRQQQEN